MRRTVWTGTATLAATALAASALMAANQPISTAQSTAGKFTVTSTNISPGGKIADAQVYNSFGCKGGNVSPELGWSSAPAGTKSFAILMHDPDAPTGSGWIMHQYREALGSGGGAAPADRKSTRLNSSHEWISYAVFCLK